MQTKNAVLKYVFRLLHRKVTELMILPRRTTIMFVNYTNLRSYVLMCHDEMVGRD